jgi:hypothetical protein
MSNRPTEEHVFPAPSVPAASGMRRYPPEPEERRGGRAWKLVVAAVVVVALLGAGAVEFAGYWHRHQQHVAASRTRAAVRTAYLAYYSAIEESLQQLSTDPVAPFLTAAGLEQQQGVLNQAIQTGYRFRVSATHDTQTFVYSGGNIASVDDIITRSTTPLDPTTLQAAGSTTSEVIHESFALRKQGGRWLVDSLASFGVGSPEPGTPMSYAAAGLGQHADQNVTRQVASDFASYWAQRVVSFNNLDPSVLGSVETYPELGLDQSLVSQGRAANQGYHWSVESNVRFASQDSTTAWAYDTYLDESYPFNFTSKASVGRSSPQIVRKAFALTKVGETWKVESDTLVQ